MMRLCELLTNGRFLTAVPVLSYVAATTGFPLISHVYGFYYVKVFLEQYHIQTWWFQIAQVSYMIWNTINDPLFGYFQDHGYFDFLKTRRRSVIVAAPLWVLSFLMAWFPWERSNPSTWVTGVHLIVALFVYDTMFTFLGLTNCALFTEISQDHDVRVKLLRWSKIGSVAASLSIFLCEYESQSLRVFWKFQVTCICVGISSFVLLLYAGRNCETQYECQGMNRSTQQGDVGIVRLTIQILKNRNFISFVVVNFFHEFHATFHTNFMAIICENLIPTSVVSLAARGSMYFLKGILPAILVIFGAPVIQSFGYYRLVRLNFVLKFILAICLYMVGKDHGWLLITIMVIDGGVNSATFALFNLSLADIAEEDKSTYNRVLPNSAMIFGTNAMLMKSVYSFAPMIVVAILNRYGYNNLKSNSNRRTPAEMNTLHNAMFNLVCFIPIVVAIVQLISWSFYELRTTHIRKHEMDVDV